MSVADDTATDDDEEVGSEKAEQLASEHPGLVALGRVGWAAKGVVYGLTGLLAVLIALPSLSGANGSGEEASQSGAVAAIADRSGGTVLLIVVAVGLVLYAAWRFVTILLPADNDTGAWLARAGYAVSMLTYLLLAGTAFSFATRPGGGESQEDSRVEELTRSVLDHGGGRIIVGLAGLAVIGLGAYFVWRGFTSDFADELEPGSVGPVSHHALVMLGRLGWGGRGLMLGLIGFFLTRAAVQYDPDDAQGLDGSLRKAADSGLGTAVVLAVAVGLVFYGLYCVISAPRQRLVGAG